MEAFVAHRRWEWGNGAGVQDANGARFAVVGGGIFRATAALHLARAGHSFVLIERGGNPHFGASRTTQRRRSTVVPNFHATSMRHPEQRRGCPPWPAMVFRWLGDVFGVAGRSTRWVSRQRQPPFSSPFLNTALVEAAKWLHE